MQDKRVRGVYTSIWNFLWFFNLSFLAPSVKKFVFSGKIDGVPVIVKVGNITGEKVNDYD